MFAICLEPALQTVSSELPAVDGRAIRGMRKRIPPLFALAPDEACRAGTVTNSAVGSYPAVSPLPAASPQAVCFLLRCLYLPKCAGVASNTRQQTPGVTRHHALRSPDFPPGTRPSGKPVHRRVYSINFCIFAPETLPCSPPARCNVRGFQKKRRRYLRFQQVLIPAFYV